MAGGAACAGGVWCHHFRRCIKVGSLASDTLGHTCQAGSYQDIKARRLFKPLLSFTCITADRFIKHRYPELNWLFQVAGGGWGGCRGHMIFQLFFPTSSSTGRTALKTHQLHILFCPQCKICLRCAHAARIYVSWPLPFSTDVWEQTNTGGRRMTEPWFRADPVATKLSEFAFIKNTKQRSGGYCARSDPKHDAEVLPERSGHQRVAEREERTSPPGAPPKFPLSLLVFHHHSREASGHSSIMRIPVFLTHTCTCANRCGVWAGGDNTNAEEKSWFI